MNGDEITVTVSVEAPCNQSTTVTTMTSTSAVTTTTSASGTVSSSGMAQLPVGLSVSAPDTPLRTVPLPLIMNAPSPARTLSSRPTFMPDSFSGQDRDWADWADQFEMAGEVNGWNDNKKLKMMALLLTGKARESYWGLAPEARSSYNALKTAMGNLLGPNRQVDWNRAELHNRERGTNESMRDFGNAIRRLVDKAYPSVDFTTRDMLAKDQYIAKLKNGDIRMHLRSAKPHDLEAAIEMASELEQIRALEKRETATVLNMFSEETQNETTVSAMQAELHKLQQEVCELRSRADRPGWGRSQPGRGQSNRTDFPTSSQGRGRAGRYRPSPDTDRACWHCGCKFHVRRDCPYVPGNASGWQ